MRKDLIWGLLAAFLVTVVIGSIYAGVQQSYRQGADDPQIQLAEDLAGVINSGHGPDELVGADRLDITASLAPFALFYDKNGEPTAGSGQIDGQLPKLPSGVIDFARNNNENRVTWQPKDNTRIALVIRKINDDKGFVAVGRSLREVEERVKLLGMMMVVAWAVALAGIAVTLVTMNFVNRKPKNEGPVESPNPPGNT
jgi:hypothetical protein